MSHHKKFVRPPLLPKNRVRVTQESLMLKEESKVPILPEDVQIKRLSNLDLATLMKLFKSDRTHFRPIIYKALYEIIDNYYYKENLPQNVNRILIYHNLADFTADLFVMKEYALVREIIKIANKIEPYNGIYDYLINSIWDDQEALEEYFKMEPPNHDWGNFDEDFEYNLEGMGLSAYDRLFVPVLKAAINTKKKDVLERIITFWDIDHENYEDEELSPEEKIIVNKIDSLIEQARMIVSQ